MMSSVFAQTIVEGVLLGATYAALGVTLTLIFGVMRIVTFCHGELLMVGLYLTFVCVTRLGIDPYLSILLVLPGMVLFALAIYHWIVKPVLIAEEHNQIVTTLALGLVLQNLALLFFTADLQSVPSAIARSTFHIGPLVFRTPVAISCIVSLSLCVALGIVLHSTALGRRIRATAQDKEAAALCGVRVDRMYALAFSVGVGMLGIIAVLLAPTLSISPSVGHEFTVTAFVIVVLGGLGNFAGAILGGMIIGLLESVGGLVTSGSVPYALTFGLFVLVLLVRPQGLFGRARL